MHAIFIHGLGGHPYETWRAARGAPSFWLEWLSNDVEGLAIWTVGYEAPISRWRGSSMHLTDRATNILELLLAEPRLRDGELVLIGHSLGGLVIKQLLRTAESMAAYRGDADAFIRRVRRVAFLATPHAGAGLATWGDLLRIAIQPSAATTSLVRNDSNLRDLNLWYREWSRRRGVRNLVLTEAKPHRIFGMVVQPDSSDPGLSRPIAIDGDHLSICKPSDRSHETFIHIKRFITEEILPPKDETTTVEAALKAQRTNLEELLHLAKGTEIAQRVEQSSIRKEIRAGPEETANIVVDRLQEIGIAAPMATPRAAALGGGASALEAGIAEALERDLRLRYNTALRRSLFPEANRIDEFHLLAKEVLEKKSVVAEDLRRQILLRAARSSAVRGKLDQAEKFLDLIGGPFADQSDLPARARLAEARGDVDGALRLLRDQTDADAKSTLLSILFRSRGEDAALTWFSEQKLSVGDLTSNGLHTLCLIHIQRTDLQSLREVLIAASSEQLTDSPCFLFLRAAVRVALLLPKPDQHLALHDFPLDVRSAHTVQPDGIVIAELDAATADIHRLLPATIDLRLPDARRLAEAYLTWCDLLHPIHRGAAIARLTVHMSKPETALPRLQFALAYDPSFDPAPISRFLDAREQLGGLNDEELRAALILCLHRDDPRGVADFIARYRTRLVSLLGKAVLGATEIQALALAGDATSAKLTLDQHRDTLDSGLVRLLEVEIAKAGGSDPVTELKAAYEATRSPQALRGLVGQLIDRQDHRAVAHYAEQLFAITSDPIDAVTTANALAKAGDDATFLRVVEAYPFVRDRNPALARHYAWKLFELGRVDEARRLVEELRTRHDAKYRDFNLEIAISIETGDWEALAVPLNALLERAHSESGLALIRAANVSHASGQGPFLGLLSAAVERGPDDANVLMGAYSLVLEEGLEEKKPEASMWFRKALDLSGPDGPIKRFELKELLSQQVDWNERTRKINDAVVKGDLPLTLAAAGLRTTVVDVLLGNLVRASAVSDPRKRAALPLFSGRRKPTKIGELTRLAVDTSALMVLSWLGLLKKVIETYPAIVLPAGSLPEMFEGRTRIRQFQKSRIERAVEIRNAIARGRLKVRRSPAAIRDPLARDVGIELGALLRAADADDGVVVRPAPVNRVGLEEEGEADLSMFKARLADMHSVLRALVEHGMIDQAKEETARHYFDLQDKGWPEHIPLRTTQATFLDGLALHYLQSVNLLQAFLDCFSNVFIDGSTEDEASAIAAYEQHSNDVLRIIDDLRAAVHEAWKAGKLQFGPQRQISTDDEPIEKSPSAILNLISDLMKADVVVLDDRALNKEPFAVDRSGHRSRIVSSLDIIEDLTTRGVLTESDRRDLRHRLRAAGATLMPVEVDEILTAALRIKVAESPEFRAIRESVSLARMANVPRFPAEVPWFQSINMAAQHALIKVWAHEKERRRAARLADAILDLRPRPEEWVTRWEGAVPPNWSEAVASIMTASLALPIELEGDEALKSYHEWLENRVLGPLRATAPVRYHRVIEHIQELLSDVGGEEDA